jgi:hypothetical protein
MATPFNDNETLGKFTADPIEKLATDVKATVQETCAKVAEIHRISRPENEFQNGYNAAVAEIAAKIRKL